ncbi:MAG: histidine phosphatase family protein, partial [Pedobacter sp.]|nr:histidine phosphatase family protein [Chitinophagaceae bacterium]
MKQLLIIRHAKSSWNLSTINDFDRPLNDRGNKDAPMMAKRLLDKKVAIDAFVSSTAKRAFNTAAHFAKIYKQPQENIIQFPELYHAMPGIFYSVISKISDDIKTIAIFSHNPGITEFVNELTTTRVDDMPTCAVFAVTINYNSWGDFKTAKKAF